MLESLVYVDDYGCLTITTPRLWRSSFADSMSFGGQFVYMTNDFLESNCRENEDGTRSLMLRGGYLFPKIKYFESWDAPYLPIFLRKHDDVTKIDLSYNNIDAGGFRSIIGHMINNDHVEELDLRYNEIGEAGIDHLQRDGENVKLKVLRLSGNKMGYEGAKKIALTVQKNNYIERLDVADIDQTEESLIYFITILRPDQERFNKSLKALDLSRPIIKRICYKFNSEHIAAAIGSMLRNNTTLEELYLQKFGFSCHDIEAMLENAKYNRTLRSLDLRCNNIGDHGMEILSNWIKRRPALRVLLLGHNIITNHGIRALSRGISFSKIKILDVSYNRFDDEGCIELLNSIKKSPMLEQLQIYGNKIGHSTAIIIRRMLMSTVLNEDRIDVKIYEVDDVLYFAYQECQTFQVRATKQSCEKFISI